MVPWYHGSVVAMVPMAPMVPMVPWYQGTRVPWYQWYEGTMGVGPNDMILFIFDTFGSVWIPDGK